MEQQKRIVNDKWIKASVLAGLWAGVEIIAGSFLHNLKIPFSGTFLTLISIVLVIGFFQIWPRYGIIWRAGLITALMKSISPSSVILGPMIAIAMEGFVMEFAIRMVGRNIMGYISAGMLTMVGILIHKIVRLYLLYGWDIFVIYEEMYNFATRSLEFLHTQPMRAVFILFVIYALLGALVALFGYKLGQRSKAEQYRDLSFSASSQNEIWDRPTEAIVYSTRYLIMLIILIPLLLYGLNNLTWVPALILTIPWFIFVFRRYHAALRQLRKWLFWMQLLVILVLAWFFTKTAEPGLEGRLMALSNGFIMVLRALVVVTGFAALSTELRAPLMQRLFFRSGFRQLYLSVNHAFGILPMVISSFTTTRRFIANPARSIATSLRYVDSWHHHLLRQLDEGETD